MCFSLTKKEVSLWIIFHCFFQGVLAIRFLENCFCWELKNGKIRCSSIQLLWWKKDSLSGCLEKWWQWMKFLHLEKHLLLLEKTSLKRLLMCSNLPRKYDTGTQRMALLSCGQSLKTSPYILWIALFDPFNSGNLYNAPWSFRNTVRKKKCQTFQVPIKKKKAGFLVPISFSGNRLKESCVQQLLITVS